MVRTGADSQVQAPEQRGNGIAILYDLEQLTGRNVMPPLQGGRENPQPLRRYLTMVSGTLPYAAFAGQPAT